MSECDAAALVETNLILAALLEDWEAHILPWDIEMIVEDLAIDDDES
jgi:hypothetical protein